MHKFTNSLIHETSPYLLQHAHNPVQWNAWNHEAFEKSKIENKPILVSIGYAACHWCHVMEHESFEDEQTAVFMNQFFINIKIDREERPDVDHIYMQACQLLTGAGGWPLNIFLTPDLKPFTGGTYFPPKPAYGKPSWMDVLIYVHDIFTKQRDKVEEQGKLLLDHIGKIEKPQISIGKIKSDTSEIFSLSELENIHKILQQQFDVVDGGFGAAPKFPAAMTLKYLLRKNFYNPSEIEVNQIHLSLYKMMFGGIYDQIGGGFARYSVDAKWKAPHFEKMLYDNALLAELYAEAYMQFNDDEYKRITDEVLHFVMREMMHEDGGFYSSYDADSEGEEGKYYTWSKAEIEKITDDDASFICKLFQVSETGNWEHTNILYRTVEKDAGDNFIKLNADEKIKFERSKEKLLNVRTLRMKPGLDDKILTGWNALMCNAFIAGYKATQNEKYKIIAEKNLRFILKACKKSPDSPALFHTYKNGIAKYVAMLDDYAAIIDALMNYYEISGDYYFLDEAISMHEYVLENFTDAEGIFFYFTHQSQNDIPVRSVEKFDHATPSGNALMFSNLLRIAIITNNRIWKERADKMFLAIKETLLKYPSSFGNWMTTALKYPYQVAETVVCGEGINQLLEQIHFLYFPNRLFMIDETGTHDQYPILQNKFDKNEKQIFICKNQQCHLPVKNREEYLEQMRNF